jgi:hypothetical protein
MEFFRERNGKYHADSLAEGAPGKAALRMGIMFVVMGVFAFTMFFSQARNQIQDKTPLLIGLSVVVFANLISLGLRRAGHGSGITVDQMNGTVSFRKPGGNRITVETASLSEIVIDIVPMKASVLCLEKNGGGRYVVMYSGDEMKMRMLADELSTLISLTVREELMDQGKNG